jgi:DNA-binding response OmpR family regulator
MRHVHKPFTVGSPVGNRCAAPARQRLCAMKLPDSSEVLFVEDMEVRPAEGLALVGGRPLPLSLRELELLSVLVRRRGHVVPREELYEAVWGAPR